MKSIIIGMICGMIAVPLIGMLFAPDRAAELPNPTVIERVEG